MNRLWPGVLHSLLIVLAALLAAALPQASYAEVLTGRVVGVADGDTLTVLDDNKVQHKIRLKGIDAPERGQAFGNRSKQSLSELVFGKDVVIEYEKRDRWGRIIGKVWGPGSVDVCLEQIRRGMAWWYDQYAKEQTEEDRLTYFNAQQEASKAEVGLWRDPVQVAPWEFRASRRR